MSESLIPPAVLSMRQLPTMQLLGLAALLLLSACASAGESRTAGAPPPDAPFDTEEANAQFHVMAGEMAANRRQPDVAAREFLKALSISPDPELAERTTQLAVMSRDPQLAREAARRWLEIDPQSLDAREVIARMALEAGDQQEVMAQARAIVDGHAGGTDEGFRHVALLLSQAESARGPMVLAVMRELAAGQPKSAGAQHALALTALRFNDLPGAEAAARRAVELSKGADEETLLLVGALVRLQRLAEADALIQQLAAKGENAGAVRFGYSRLLLEAGQREAARNQLKKALAADPKQDDIRFALGVLATSDREYAQAEQYLQPLLTTPRAQDAALQLGRIEELRKRYDKALEYYGRVTTGMTAVEALVRRANVLAQIDRMNDGIALLRQTREQIPPLAPRMYRAETELLTDHGKNAEALKLLDEAIDEYPEDDELVYNRSLIYERLGQMEAAEKDLRQLLEADPDDARALNGLGYMLLTNTARVDEAAKLIRRAHELEPEDAAITDSLGWAEYKRGRKQEALQWLQRAYDKLPDPEVAAHLGEVLWALGEKERARGIWDKALLDDPDHRVLKETVQRLTE